jgi:PAS domain S-box-containing protein/diguanylate cyclase (GGDEF)-like protein
MMHSRQRTVDGEVPAHALIDAELLKKILDCVDDGVCLLDRDNQVLYWNHGAERITGFLAQEVFGRHCREDLALCHDHDGAAVPEAACPLNTIKQDGKSRECTIYLRHRDGHRIPVRMRVHPILDEAGQVAGVAEVFANACARGRTELATAARHGGHDGLTGALNREYGEMLLAHELASMKRFGLASAWIRADVDGLDALARRFGHGMVESVMRMIAQTVDANLNSYDALIRWDASSFRIMVRHAVEEHVRELAAKLATMIRTSQVQWWGEQHDVEVTIASVMTDPEDSVDTLEERAAAAIESLRTIRGGCLSGPTCKQTCKEDCSG